MEYAIKNNGLYESIIFNSNVILTEGNVTLLAKLADNEFTKYKNITGKAITSIDLPDTVIMKLVSKHPFTYSIPGINPHYYNKHKIENYLYEITYGNIDYEYAQQYFKELFNFGCSSIRKGNFFGRNFDWLYNNQVQFVVHTPSSFNRYAVLGVSGIIPGIEQSNVDNDEIIIESIDMFKLIPFYLLDGINELGVFCTHNVVPLDDEISPTKIITAKIKEKDRISIPMLPRFVLDKFSSAKLALDYLIDYTTVYFTDTMIASKYLSHFLLGDRKYTYVVEFINGEIKVINAKYITNFNIHNVLFNKNNTILYPPTLFGVSKYGSGLERWDIIAKNYKQANSLIEMRNLLDSIKYSNTYSSTNFWYSEIVRMTDDDGNKITVDTNPEKCTNAKLNMLYLYRTKDRDNPKVWITCHSSIYDIFLKKLYITNQESDIEYIFNI